MATKEMQLVTDYAPGKGAGKSWQYTESLSTAGNTSDVLIPSGCKSVMVTIEANGTTMSVTTSTEPVNTITDGTPTFAAVSALTTKATATCADVGGVAAVRGTQNGSGTSKMTIRAQ